MIKLYENGVYLLNGTEIVEDTGNVQVPLTKEEAAQNTMAYGILKAHNTSENMERLQIRDILKSDRPPVRITVSMEDLVTSAMKQNFVPVVDDLGSFIGIVTRKDIIRYLSEQKSSLTLPEALKKIV